MRTNSQSHQPASVEWQWLSPSPRRSTDGAGARHRAIAVDFDPRIARVVPSRCQLTHRPHSGLDRVLSRGAAAGASRSLQGRGWREGIESCHARRRSEKTPSSSPIYQIEARRPSGSRSSQIGPDWPSASDELGMLARVAGLGRKLACPNLTCGNFSDVPPLEASEFELIRAWLARPVWPRDGARAVRTAARDLI